jgi:hypothetical protein
MRKGFKTLNPKRQSAKAPKHQNPKSKQKSRELLSTLTEFLDLLCVSANLLVPHEFSPEEIANAKGILTQWNCSQEFQPL